MPSLVPFVSASRWLLQSVQLQIEGGTLTSRHVAALGKLDVLGRIHVLVSLHTSWMLHAKVKAN